MNGFNQLRFNKAIFLGLFLFTVLSPLPSNAQLTRGTISGTLTDSTNAVLAGAQVTIRPIGK